MGHGSPRKLLSSGEVMGGCSGSLQFPARSRCRSGSALRYSALATTQPTLVYKLLLFISTPSRCHTTKACLPLFLYVLAIDIQKIYCPVSCAMFGLRD